MCSQATSEAFAGNAISKLLMNMLQRPEQHVIDEMGQRILRGALPPEWVLNPLNNDYGKDYLFEPTLGGRISGDYGFMQLKSHRTVTKTRNGYSEKLKQKHLSHFAELKCPLFLVTVDTTTGDIYIASVTDYLEDQDNTKWRKQKTISIPIAPISKGELASFVSRTSRSIWTRIKMHDPQAIPRAVEIKRRMLTSIEPRFDYEISITNGNEAITLIPKEAVNISLTASSSSADSSLNRRLDDLILKGTPLDIGSNDSLAITGTPLFDCLGSKLVRIELGIQRPIEVHIALRGSTDRIEIPLFDSLMNGGVAVQKVHCARAGFPLEFHLTLGPHDGERVHMNVQMNWSLDAWKGRLFTEFPWCEIMGRAATVLASPSPKMEISLMFEGNTLAAFEHVLKDGVDRIKNLASAIEYLLRARAVARTLRLESLRWNGQLGERDVHDIEELEAVIGGGEFKYDRRVDMSFSIPSGSPQIVHLRHEAKSLRVENESPTYDFFGHSFPVPGWKTYLTDWRAIDERPDENNFRFTRFTFKDCVRSTAWDRRVA